MFSSCHPKKNVEHKMREIKRERTKPSNEYAYLRNYTSSQGACNQHLK